MKKTAAYLACAVFVVVMVCPAWADKPESPKVQAAALIAEGERLLAITPSALQKNGNELYYEATCDAPEKAQELFNQAAALDPSNAAAWSGWGKAIEKSGFCQMRRQLSWNQQNGFEYYDMFTSILENKPDTQNYNEASEKFEKAVEAAPDDSQLWAAWGSNLFKRAADEKNAALRQELGSQGSQKYDKAAQLKPDDQNLQQAWGRGLMEIIAIEDDEAAWHKLLAEALVHFDKYVEMSPETKPENSDDKSVPKKQARRLIINDLGMPFSLNKLSSEKEAALVLAVAERLTKTAYDESDDEDAFMLKMAMELILAKHEKDPQKWRQHIAKSKEYYEQSLSKSSQNNTEPDYFTIDMWLYFAHMIDEREKQEAIAAAGLETYKEIAGRDKREVSPENILSDIMGKTTTIAHLALFLPDGKDRDELIATVAPAYESALSKTDAQKHSRVYAQWGNTLLKLASGEKSEEKYLARLKESDQMFEKSISQFQNLPNVNGHAMWAIYLNFAADEEKNADRRRILLKKALNSYEQVKTEAIPPGFMITPAQLYYKLALLEKDDSFQKQRLTEQALRQYSQMVDQADPGVYINAFNRKGRFFYGLMLLNISSSPDGQRRHTVEAMKEFRRYFSDLPEIAEKDAHNAGISGNRYAMTAAGAQQQNFQAFLTPKVAEHFPPVYQALAPDGLDAYRMIQLAGLYRYLAWSGLLLPHYQEFYLQKSEALLRQALAYKPKAEPEPEKTEPDAGQDKKIDRKAVEKQRMETGDRALALRELGLILAEKSLAAAAGKTKTMREAEELWKEAETLVPGSSRYAKARWAARQADLKSLKEYLPHTYTETSHFIFPSWQEAKDDPAFSNYINETWFRKAWYGFDAKAN